MVISEEIYNETKHENPSIAVAKCLEIRKWMSKRLHRAHMGQSVKSKTFNQRSAQNTKRG